ncbi:MAG: hypothetical protein PHN98_12400 [Smithellaceae bacterium]|nr:hypothetical protein [Smithellaceae bacterium]
MSIKIYVIILASCFALLIGWAVVGGMLESSGIKIDPMTIEVIAFTLFLVIGFAIVPIMIRLFIRGQIKIGNGDRAVIKFLQAHEQKVVYCIWGFYAFGLIYLLPVIKNDLFQ